MTVENDFIPFCQTTGVANLPTQSAYASDPIIENGNQPGIASSAKNNKALRQATTMAAAVASAIVQLTGQAVVDSDGALSTITTNLIAAMAAAATDAVLPCGTATGTANALILTPAVPIPAYTYGVPFSFVAASNNTGAAQVNISGKGLIALTKGNATALAANDIEAGHSYIAILTSPTNACLINLPSFAHGSDVAAASTLVLNGTGGDIANITGSATISTVTLNEGRVKVCKFASGGAVLTPGGSLLTNANGSSYTIAANDVVIFYGLASSVVVAIIIPANGQSPVSVSLPTYGANTVVVNATTGTANPTGLALSASQLAGRGATGNVAAIGLAGNMNMAGGTTLTANQKMKQQVITASGNFTTDANISASTVFNFRLIAGGAGGSGCLNGTSGPSGGAGETVDWNNVTGLAPSTNYSVSIGAGGGGGSSGANAGSAGGNTSITIGSDTVSANGGYAGGAGGNGNGGVGGNGAHSTPSVGTVTGYPGGGGQAGINSNYSIGGASGGNSSLGGGANSTYNGSGINALGYGGGGGGGNGANGNGPYAGGNGKSGILIITWIE